MPNPGQAGPGRTAVQAAHPSVPSQVAEGGGALTMEPNLRVRRVASCPAAPWPQQLPQPLRVAPAPSLPATPTNPHSCARASASPCPRQTQVVLAPGHPERAATGHRLPLRLFPFPEASDPALPGGCSPQSTADEAAEAAELP